jgi:predicted Zn-dependent peptidase
MIKFERYKLDNGLRVILHHDKTTPMVTVNVIYDVGSRDEKSNKTGFAHLFEHLMFGGTPRFPDYDIIAQQAGAANNAFTSKDLTNYYISLPAANLETGLMLEADRMAGLQFSPESLEVQRKVVIEEFKQRYLNKPYGDVWLELSKVAYREHPYAWQTIGKKIEHIEDATLDDVKNFFSKHYNPKNAVLSISGNIDIKKVKKQVDKWFGSINQGIAYKRDLPKEQLKTQKQTLTIKRDVPQSAIYKVYQMPGRNDPAFYSGDLLSDLLGRGLSSRIYKKLVSEKRIFTSAGASVTGNFDPGLFIMSGMLSPEVDFETAEKALDEIIEDVKTEEIPNPELEKIKNKVESTFLFNNINHSDVAFHLAWFELMGDANDINKEVNKYREVSKEEIRSFARKYLDNNRSTALYYEAKPSEI